MLLTLKEELPTLKNRFKVKRIGIFGSYVEDNQTLESDIDMLVEEELRNLKLDIKKILKNGLF